MTVLIQQIAKYLRDNDNQQTFTPASDVSAGDPIVMPNGQYGIPLLDVPTGTTGEFYTDGLFQGKKSDPSDAMSAGDLLDLDVFGFVPNGENFLVEADSASGELVVLIRPNPGGGIIADGSVTNQKLSDMPPWTIKARNNGATGSPEDVAEADLTEEGAPTVGHKLYGTVGGQLRKFDVGNLPTGSGGEVNDTRNDGGGPEWGKPKEGLALPLRTPASDNSSIELEQVGDNIQFRSNVEWANAQFLGATGDGVADDTAAVEAAISSGNPTVYFPGGTYRVLNSISPAPGQKWLGDGNARLLYDGVEAPFFVNVNASNCKIEQLQIDGNSKAAVVLRIAPTTVGTQVARNRIGNAGHTSVVCAGIEFGHSCDETLITDNTIHDISAAAATASRGIRGTGFGDVTNRIKGVRITGNHIDRVVPATDGDGIVIQDWTAPADVVISDNTFERCSKRCIKVNVTPGVTVTSNTCRFQAFETYTNGTTAISMQAGSGIVNNNNIEGLWGQGLELGPGAVDGIVASGNSINLEQFGGFAGIEVNTTGKGVTISGGSIKMGQRWRTAEAVDVGDHRTADGFQNLYICTQAGTTATEPTGTGVGIVDGTAIWDYVSDAGRWGIRVNAATQGVSISGVTIDGTKDSSIELSGNPTVMAVTGCTFLNRSKWAINGSGTSLVRSIGNQEDGTGFEFSSIRDLITETQDITVVSTNGAKRSYDIGATTGSRTSAMAQMISELADGETLIFPKAEEFAIPDSTIPNNNLWIDFNGCRLRPENLTQTDQLISFTGNGNNVRNLIADTRLATMSTVPTNYRAIPLRVTGNQNLFYDCVLWGSRQDDASPGTVGLSATFSGFDNQCHGVESHGQFFDSGSDTILQGYFTDNYKNQLIAVTPAGVHQGSFHLVDSVMRIIESTGDPDAGGIVQNADSAPNDRQNAVIMDNVVVTRPGVNFAGTDVGITATANYAIGKFRGCAHVHMFNVNITCAPGPAGIQALGFQMDQSQWAGPYNCDLVHIKSGVWINARIRPSDERIKVMRIEGLCMDLSAQPDGKVGIEQISNSETVLKDFLFTSSGTTWVTFTGASSLPGDSFSVENCLFDGGAGLLFRRESEPFNMARFVQMHNTFTAGSWSTGDDDVLMSAKIDGSLTDYNFNSLPPDNLTLGAGQRTVNLSDPEGPTWWHNGTGWVSNDRYRVSRDDGSVQGVLRDIVGRPGAILGYSSDGTLQPTDGAVTVEPGKTITYGSQLILESLKHTETTRQIAAISQEGQVYTYPEPDQGWSATDSDSADYDLGAPGTGVGVWTALTTLTLNTPQEATAGSRFDIDVTLFAVNKTSNRSGNLEIYVSVDGAVPGGLDVDDFAIVSPGFAGNLTLALRDLADNTYPAGTAITIYARANGGSGNNYGLDLTGSVSAHRLLVSVAGAGGGASLPSTSGNERQPLRVDPTGAFYELFAELVHKNDTDPPDMQRFSAYLPGTTPGAWPTPTKNDQWAAYIQATAGGKYRLRSAFSNAAGTSLVELENILEESNTWTGQTQVFQNASAVEIELFQTGQLAESGRFRWESASGFHTLTARDDSGLQVGDALLGIAHRNNIAGQGVIVGNIAFPGADAVAAAGGFFDSSGQVYSPGNPPPAGGLTWVNGGTKGGTDTIDWSLGQRQFISLTGLANTVWNPADWTNAPTVVGIHELLLTQDTTALKKVDWATLRGLGKVEGRLPSIKQADSESTLLTMYWDGSKFIFPSENEGDTLVATGVTGTYDLDFDTTLKIRVELSGDTTVNLLAHTVSGLARVTPILNGFTWTWGTGYPITPPAAVSSVAQLFELETPTS